MQEAGKRGNFKSSSIENKSTLNDKRHYNIIRHTPLAKSRLYLCTTFPLVQRPTFRSYSIINFLFCDINTFIHCLLLCNIPERLTVRMHKTNEPLFKEYCTHTLSITHNI